MGYEDITDRDSVGEIPAEETAGIIEEAKKTSVALQTFRTIPMSRKQRKFRVLDVLPDAYWVNGDTGLKQTTSMEWSKVTMEAEPLAVIVPIPDDVIDDNDFDLWGEYRPAIAEAFARKLDAACFFGAGGAPDTFSDGVAVAAAAMPSSGNAYTSGTATSNAGGVIEDVNQLYIKLENQGVNPNFNVANISLR